MGVLPLLRRENQIAAAQADGAARVPFVLPKVQEGNHDQRPALSSVRGRQQNRIVSQTHKTQC